MKKTILVLTVMMIGALALMSFTNKEKRTTKTEIVEQSSDCVRIYVKYSNGSKCTNGRISGDGPGGITKTFYLNDDGYADICYTSSYRLITIYINGTSYDGNYYKGKSYTIYKR